MAYLLSLSDEATIHPVFNESKLKGQICTSSMAFLNLPYFAIMDQLDSLLRAIINHRRMHCNRRLIKEYLIWWHGLSLDDVMWAYTFELHHRFLNY